MGRTRRSLHDAQSAMGQGLGWTLMRHFLGLSLSVGGLPGRRQVSCSLGAAVEFTSAPEAFLARNPCATGKAVAIAAVAARADDDLIAAAGACVKPEAVACQNSAAKGLDKDADMRDAKGLLAPVRDDHVPRALSRRLRSLGDATSGAPPICGG